MYSFVLGALACSPSPTSGGCPAPEPAVLVFAAERRPGAQLVVQEALARGVHTSTRPAEIRAWGLELLERRLDRIQVRSADGWVRLDGVALPRSIACIAPATPRIEGSLWAGGREQEISQGLLDVVQGSPEVQVSEDRGGPALLLSWGSVGVFVSRAREPTGAFYAEPIGPGVVLSAYER